ncbi:hypothetical protein [Glaciihabitans sp. dw_435]|uniref:FMN-binding protein n=1 Tax=Glaciihabitans sp. dw_435 TaxID=2720081 RepID=UPI001BD24191|nr:hypothetical protein [Glaciihabitans sp. dw_435]
MTPLLRSKYVVGTFAGLSLVTVLAGCSSTTEAASSGSTTPSDSSSSSSDTTTSTGSATSFKDGSYTEEGSYVSPGGNQTVKVELTIASGAVTAVTVTPEATDPTATRYQTEFAGGISAEVVGKQLSDLTVSRVAGSSLTSGGFNDAVDKIKADATS